VNVRSSGSFVTVAGSLLWVNLVLTKVNPPDVNNMLSPWTHILLCSTNESLMSLVASFMLADLNAAISELRV